MKEADDILKKGGLICYPTDTVWGIGCDATNPDAVSRIFTLKQRNDSKSLIVLIDHEDYLANYVHEVPEIAWQLIETSEPLTIVYPGAKNIAPNLIADDGSVAIRVVKNLLISKIMHRLQKPLVSTSANISGENTPMHFSEIHKAILQGVDLVINKPDGEMMTLKPSPIIKIEQNGVFRIIRS